MLNWKDRFDDKGRGCYSEAGASREIGGRYEIMRWDGGDTNSFGFIEGNSYDLR
jgi:hypothetical protein